MTIALVVAGIAALALVFVLLTDGRYFGKGLVRWVYDHFGASIFRLQSEADRWRALAEQLSMRGDEQILDAGTAIGDLALSFASRPGFCGRVVGIDWSPRMIAAAAEAADQRGLADKARFEVVDLREGLPFEEAAFDLVFCLGLLETLPHPEAILGELCRVLAPKGRIVLSLYRGWSVTGATLSLKWYRRHLAAFGLGDIQVLPCRRTQDVVVARRTLSDATKQRRINSGLSRQNKLHLWSVAGCAEHVALIQPRNEPSPQICGDALLCQRSSALISVQTPNHGYNTSIRMITFPAGSGQIT